MSASFFIVARAHPDGTALFLDDRPIWDGNAFHWTAYAEDAVQLTLAEANDYAHRWNERPDALRTDWIARVERGVSSIRRRAA